jgi:hypothetical protein
MCNCPAICLPRRPAISRCSQRLKRERKWGQLYRVVGEYANFGLFDFDFDFDFDFESMMKSARCSPGRLSSPIWSCK